jgi:thiol-disulfide isomerase/thioredoxin
LPFETADDGLGFSVNGLQGRVVLITFIATWCFPCLADLVTIKRLASLYGARGFSNVLVGMDLEGRRVLEPFAKEYQLDAPLLVADDRIRSGNSAFGAIRELPSRLLFGRDGALVVAFSGVTPFQDLARLVEAELARG